jgi:hypothetical protein
VIREGILSLVDPDGGGDEDDDDNDDDDQECVVRSPGIIGVGGVMGNASYEATAALLGSRRGGGSGGGLSGIGCGSAVGVKLVDSEDHSTTTLKAMTAAIMVTMLVVRVVSGQA